LPLNFFLYFFIIHFVCLPFFHSVHPLGARTQQPPDFNILLWAPSLKEFLKRYVQLGLAENAGALFPKGVDKKWKQGKPVTFKSAPQSLAHSLPRHPQTIFLPFEYQCKGCLFYTVASSPAALNSTDFFDWRRRQGLGGHAGADGHHCAAAGGDGAV
jgi:hypothetical protein